MKRMKTFLLYALGIIGFMLLSLILEDGLIESMYVKMSGNISSTSSEISIEDVTGKASNVNGYLNFTLKNNSSQSADRKYIKIDLFRREDTPSATKYVEIKDLDPGESKNYSLKINGNKLRKYDISIIDANELPDKTNIINILGWEIDLSNVFGLDLTEVSIFGVKLSDIVNSFNMSTIKEKGLFAWSWVLRFLGSIPWWGYAIGAGIVLWYMPTRYLFGIFPL